MLQSEALAVLKEKGCGAVKRERGTWNEHGVQFVIHRTTKNLCWTAGGTCGGDFSSNNVDVEFNDWCYYPIFNPK